MRPRRLRLPQARRIALAAQGFARPRPGGRVDIRHVRGVAERLGLIQLDYVNVLVPAHYHVPFARLGPYDRKKLDELAYGRRELTEHWAHEASLVRMDHWPLLEYRRSSHRARPWPMKDFIADNPEYFEAALEIVREEGGITPDRLPPPPGDGEVGHDWYSSVERCVLEAHFGCGRLAVRERLPNFVRVYDLVERIVPEEHRVTEVEPEEAHRRLLRHAARAHGVATADDLADYWRMSMRDARPRIDELLQSGELLPARVDGWSRDAYLHPEARLPRGVEARALVSPFDPLVWTRSRVARLFGMDYRLEIFVPKKKRKWGYFVVPFLLGDRLVARVDLKADRRAGRLRVLSAYPEDHTDVASTAPPLARELETFASWLGLDAVAVSGDGALSDALRRVLP